MSILKVRLNKLSSDWQIARAVLEDEYKEYLAKALDRIRTRYEFASHLLDVHRMWCAECPHSGCPAQPVRSDRDTCAAESASGEPGFQLAAARDMSIHAGLLDNSGEDNIEDYKISGTALPLEVACNDEDGENQTVTLNDKVIKQENCDDNNSQENFKNEKQREEGSEASFLYQIPHSHIPDVPPQSDWTNNVSDIHILIKQEESSQECYDIVMEGSENRTELHQGHEEDRKTILGNSEPPRSSYEHGSEAFIQAQSGIDEPSKITHDMTGHSPEEASHDQSNTDGKIFLEIENKSGPSRFTFNTKHSPEASVQVQCDASIGEPLSSAHGINRQSSEDSVQDQCNTGDSSSNIVQHHSKGQSSSNINDFYADLKTQSKPKPQSQRADTGQKSNQCSICKKDFTRNHHLIRHMRTHTGDKPFRCTICNKAFSLSRKLSQHEIIHTGDKPYQCTLCNKAFSFSGNLSRHIRTHTGNKPYQCTVCNKAFSCSSNLSEHMRTHTGNKPYHCSVCNKTFSFSSNFSCHMRIHTGEKPYQCSVCNKTFSDGSSFCRHKKTHTGK